MAEVTKHRKTGRQQKGLYKLSIDSETVDTYFNYDGNYMIYGLSSTEEPERIRYVGCTSQKTNIRSSHHRSRANRYTTSKDKWLKELFDDGHNFIFVLLKEAIVCEKEADNQEKNFIHLYRRKDSQLLNVTAGGKGTTGLQHTEETKAKMSKANMGKPFRKGKPLTVKQRLYLRNTARKRRAIAKEKGVKCN